MAAFHTKSHHNLPTPGYPMEGKRRSLYNFGLHKSALCLALLFCLSSPAKAACLIESPYKNGEYAERLLDFVAGYWISLGENAIDYGITFREKKPLHTFRLINPAQRVLGCPKTSLEDALTLGHEGYVIVGPRNCFRDGPGPDILIHEPRTDINTNESFNVYVTPDSKGQGPWTQGHPAGR